MWYSLIYITIIKWYCKCPRDVSLVLHSITDLTFNGHSSEFLHKRIPLNSLLEQFCKSTVYILTRTFYYLQIYTLKTTLSLMLHRMQRYYLLRCLSYKKSKNARVPSRLLEKEIKIMFLLKYVIAIK